MVTTSSNELRNVISYDMPLCEFCNKTKKDKGTLQAIQGLEFKNTKNESLFKSEIIITTVCENSRCTGGITQIKTLKLYDPETHTLKKKSKK